VSDVHDTHAKKTLWVARHNNDDNDNNNDDNNDNNGNDDNNDNNDNSDDANRLNLPIAPAVPPLFFNNHQQELPRSSSSLPSHLQNWPVAIFCRGRMIAATWSTLTIAQGMPSVVTESTQACKSQQASHRMTRLVLSDVTCSVSDLFACCIETSHQNHHVLPPSFPS
jgi:hypothetical protein